MAIKARKQPVKLLAKIPNWKELDKMRMILCLDTGEEFYYSKSKTPYQIMENLIYILNWRHEDKESKIKVTNSGKCLFFEHGGKTYTTINN